MTKQVKAVHAEVGGIKCDTEGCDYRDDAVKFEDFKDWVNKPCPKCGGNLLTEADLKLAQDFMRSAELVNNIFNARFTPEEMADMALGSRVISASFQSDGNGKLVARSLELKEVNEGESEDEEILTISLIGKRLSDDLKKTIESYYSLVRYISPNDVVTRDYVQFRTNIHTTQDGIIIAVKQG